VDSRSWVKRFLEAFEDFAGLGIAGRDGTTGAWIAALEIYFADFEADYAAFVFAEELIFPEGGDAVDFERGAERWRASATVTLGKPCGVGPNHRRQIRVRQWRQ